MEDSQRYESAKLALGFAGFAAGVVLLTLLWLSGGSVRIRAFAEAQTASPPLIVALYFAIVGGLFTIVQLPLDFLSGYVLEHRFGLSRQSLGAWVIDQVKGLLLGAILSLAGAEAVYYLLRSQPERWWIYGALIFIAFFVTLNNLAPVLFLPLFFKFTAVDDPTLRKRVDELARRAGTRVNGIFEWSLGERTRKANAAVVGWGNTRRIIISDTLLRNCSIEELEVIMAHELCHHVKGHIWLGMGLQAILTFGSFYMMNVALVHFGGAFRGLADAANFPLLALTALVLSALVLPATNYFSRRLEFAADLYALDMTGDSLAFVSAMDKLADLNLANKTPNKLIEFLFYSHPAIEDRVKLAADHVGQNV